MAGKTFYRSVLNDVWLQLNESRGTHPPKPHYLKPITILTGPAGKSPYRIHPIRPQASAEQET